MKNTKTNKIATHIGWDVAALGHPMSPTMRSPSVVLMEVGGVEEGCGVVPAASIVIQGEDSVRQLRDFCYEVLGGKDRPAPPDQMAADPELAERLVDNLIDHLDLHDGTKPHVELPPDFAEIRELIFVLLSYYQNRKVPVLQEYILKRLNLVPEATFSKLNSFLKQ